MTTNSTPIPKWREFKKPGLKAQELLDRLKLKAPFDINHLIESLDIKLFKLDEDVPYVGICNVNVDSAEIGIRRTDSYVRQRFTIAHELGHILLHEGTQFRDLSIAGGFTQLEREANKFAAELLMPDWQVRLAVRQLGNNVDALASLFKVSKPAMQIRLGELYVR